MKKINYPFTHPEKVLYPELGITKREIANFYESIQDWILPYIIKRPLTLVRCPNGREKKCFFQKHFPDMPADLYGIDIQEKNKKGTYVYLKNIRGLFALTQLNVLEVHTWNCRIDKIERPDMIVFDLDPAPDIHWKKVIEAAWHIKDRLEKLNLVSFVKTTGGKGLHIVLPIKRTLNWETITLFSHTFVDALVAEYPDRYISSMKKSNREGKIFIDYLRNQRGATAIAPYSIRAHENAPVATPLAWDELSVRLPSNYFTIRNLPKRLMQLKQDPWQDFFTLNQVLNIHIDQT